MNVRRSDTATGGEADDLHFRGPSTTGRLACLRSDLGRWARQAGMADAGAEGLVLACYEAMANVAVHAYRGQPGVLEVHAVAERNTLQVSVTDHGRWQPPPADPGLFGGRGLPLIRGLADTVEIVPTGGGTTVRMCWARPPVRQSGRAPEPGRGAPGRDGRHG